MGFEFPELRGGFARSVVEGAVGMVYFISTMRK